MTKQSSSSQNRVSHLRAYAAVQKQTTVTRLKQAIEALEVEGRPVNTFTIKEHSTHLCKEREQEQAKHQATSSGRSQQSKRGQAVAPSVKVSPRDPLLDYKRPRLVELLYEAWAERDEAKQQLRAERVEAEQQSQAKLADLERRYHKLLQEHTSCGVAIAKLEAQAAEYLALMERFRTALRNEEHGTQP